MVITLIGLICIASCALVFASPLRWGLVVLGVFLPLRAAAAINLPAFGNSSILCAQIVVAAFAASILARPKLAQQMLRSIFRVRAVVLLGLFVAYATLTSLFMPRLFAGAIDVFTLERLAEGYAGGTLRPLKPTTGNITQSLYLASELVLFSLIVFVASREGGLRRVMRLFTIITAVHLLCAAFNAIPGLNGLLDLIRTANYEIHQNHQVAGIRRIIGSYPEASEFGAASALLFAFNLLRYLQTRGAWYLLATISLLGCIAAALSTTGYAALGLFGLVIIVNTLFRLMRRGLAGEQLFAVLLSFMAIAALAAMFLFAPVQEFVGQIYELLFGSKLESQSGRVRSALNMQGLQNLVDSMGFGVGLGSTRSSSVAIAVISNTGVIGATLYTAFLATSYLRPWPKKGRLLISPKRAGLARRYFNAARAAALTGFMAGLVSGGIVDTGPLYFAAAAFATGAVARAKAPARVRRRKSAGFGPQPVFAQSALAAPVQWREPALLEFHSTARPVGYGYKGQWRK